jgi:hypothetical protein
MSETSTPVTAGPRPRRRSIFGGVLFIVVGIILLMATMRPDIDAWRWFGDYWPVILILWGLAKMFDYAISRRTGEAVPRALSGGEIFLLILVIGFGAAVSAGRTVIHDNPELGEVFGPWWGEDFTFSEEVAAGMPVKPGSLVKINNYRGNVEIHAEETGEIRVVSKKSLRASNDAEANRIARDISVTVREVPGGIEVRPELKDEGYRRVRVDMEIHVPKSVNIEAETDRGGISVAGITGKLRLNSARGDVEVRDAGSEVSVDLKGGDVRIQGVQGAVRISGRGSEIEVADVTGDAVIQGEFYGPIRTKNVAKEVRFVSQRTDLTISNLPGRMEMGGGDLEIYDTPGSVTVTTRNKDIVFENVGGRISVENRRGNVEVRMRQAPKEELSITNESGTVELGLPESSTFELTATSRQGDVESDFQGPDLKSSRDDRTNTLQGRVGSRGPRIQLKTTYGSVRIRKIG